LAEPAAGADDDDVPESAPLDFEPPELPQAATASPAVRANATDQGPRDESMAGR
jgi:hypothetical protein